MTTTKFTTDHEWVLIEDGSATVGITDYAQEQLGDVVYVELPEVGQTFTAGENVAVVESVKAVGEINMPLDGAINAVNESLEDEPELVNGDATGAGWLFKMTPADPAQAGELMDDAAYGEYVSGL